MRMLALYLAKLYPRRWRNRYGAEFDALLEDTPLTVADLAGILAGAIRLHLFPINFEPQESTMDNPTHTRRVLDWQQREIPNGFEVEMVLECPQADGSSILDRQFWREVDLGDFYVHLNHRARGAENAQTMIVYGIKGEESGDFRTDRTQLLVLHADGTVERTEQTVKTWTRGDAFRRRAIAKYRELQESGLSPNQIFERFRQEHGGESPS